MRALQLLISVCFTLVKTFELKIKYKRKGLNTQWNEMKSKDFFMFQSVQFMYCMWWKLDAVLKFLKCLTFCRMYQDKLAHLKKQLQQLEEGTLPEYIKKRKKIDQQYKERIRVNEIWREFEVKLLYDSTSLLDLISI